MSEPMTQQDRLRALVEKWQKEEACYRSGLMLSTPVGEMNRASADTVKRFLLDLSALLTDEAQEPSTDHLVVDRIENPKARFGVPTSEPFELWWERDGQYVDPDTDDVPWFDKRKALAELAFIAAIAQSGNYTADREVAPTKVTFVNGRQVRLAASRAETAPQWQPIETAPKDGTEILLTDGNYKRVGNWAKRRECWSIDAAVQMAMPTRWMPLPKEPKP